MDESFDDYVKALNLLKESLETKKEEPISIRWLAIDDIIFSIDLTINDLKRESKEHLKRASD